MPRPWVLVLALTACAFASQGESGGTSVDSNTDGTGTTAPPPGSSAGPSSTTVEPPMTAGSACGEPLAGSFADCVNTNASACGNEDASCLVNTTVNPAWGVCFLACEDECDCWAAPASGNAVTTCAPVLQGGTACILECSSGLSCPDGMECIALDGVTSACVFPNENFDATSSSGEPSSSSEGDSSTTGGSTTTGSGTDTDTDSSGSSSSSGTSTGTSTTSGA